MNENRKDTMMRYPALWKLRGCFLDPGITIITGTRTMNSVVLQEELEMLLGSSLKVRFPVQY
jgi:hypothetical protein